MPVNTTKTRKSTTVVVGLTGQELKDMVKKYYEQQIPPGAKIYMHHAGLTGAPRDKDVIIQWSWTTETPDTE